MDHLPPSPPPPHPQHTHTHKAVLLWTVGFKYHWKTWNDLWYKNVCQVKEVKTPVQVFYWYFQPIIRIRLLSRLEQLTNLGFGEWQLSIYVVLFLLSLYKNLMFIFVFVVVVCPPIFALIDVLFCEIDDLKPHTKIPLWTDFVVERKTKNPL